MKISLKQAELDQRVYALAKEYLFQLNVEVITSELLEKYLHLSEIKPRPDSVAEIYKCILQSAQNANMRAGVIGVAIGGVEKLGIVLCDFQPLALIEKYSTGWESVLDEIEEVVKPTGKIRRASRGIWPHYCQTIISAAQFMAQFSTTDEFYKWVSFFDQDERARPALPMLLDSEIDGFGFALACDFLKELGYVNFAKPDVHLHDIFVGLELCLPKAKDYHIFKAIVRVAKNANVKAYNVDKLFWLIGSGYFYNDPQIGKNGRIGRRKSEFIAYAQSRMRI